MERIWIVVGDSSRAHIFEAKRLSGKWKQIHSLEHPSSRLRELDITTGKSGGSQHKGTQSVLDSFDPSTSPKEVEKRLFAHEVAGILEKAIAEHDYDKVVLVAGPKFLGRLRQELSTEVSRSVFKTVDKNFSMIKPQHVPEKIKRIICAGEV